MFPYLETDAQWAAYTIRDLRARRPARASARATPRRGGRRCSTRGTTRPSAPDGADVFALVATRARVGRAPRARSLGRGAASRSQGERATVVTSRGTRYPFRLRDNGIWGLTIFTAELAAEAERAARDLDVVKHAAEDYDRARGD